MKCPICEYSLKDCQCRFSSYVLRTRSKRQKVAKDHLYLFPDAVVKHIQFLEEWWRTSYDDPELTEIYKDLVKEWGGQE